MGSLGSLGNTNLSRVRASWKMCICQDLRLSLFCACSYLTRSQRTRCCQSSLPASGDARAVCSWESTDAVVTVFRGLGFFMPLIKYFLSPILMCFRTLDRSVVKQKWGISSTHAQSQISRLLLNWKVLLFLVCLQGCLGPRCCPRGWWMGQAPGPLRFSMFTFIVSQYWY